MPDAASEAVTYIKALLSNAEDLLNESRLLLTHQRWARAFALAVLAEEEAGKALLAVSRLMPVDELADLKPTRHEDKLTAAAITELAFLSNPTDFAAQAGAIDSGALHREKLAAIYVDCRPDGLQTPSTFTQQRAEAAVDRTNHIVRWTVAQLGQVDPAAIETAALLSATLTPTMDQFVVDHGIDAGIQLARQLVHWGRAQALAPLDEP